MFNKFRRDPKPERAEGNHEDAQELISLGIALMQSEDAQGALDLFEQALAINPSSEYALLLKGNALAALGRAEEAMPYFDRILQQNPGSETAWFGKGMAVMQMRRYQEALGYLEKSRDLGYPGAAKAIEMCRELIAQKPKAQTSESPVVEELLSKGLRLGRAGRWQEALACAERATQLDPKSSSAWALNGMILGEVGRAREALAALDRAIDLDKYNEDAWLEKGFAYGNLGETEKAIECYDQIIALKPEFGSAWFNKGGLLMELERYAEALECLRQAERLGIEQAAQAIARINERIEGGLGGSAYTDHARHLYQQGIKLAEGGREVEAIEYFQRAVKASPRYLEAWYALGYGELQLDRPIEALKCFDRVLEIDPELGSAWKQKAMALAQLGSTDEAIECFDRGLQIDPEDENAWINKGIILLNDDRPDAAQPCFERAKALNHPRADQYLERCADAIRFGAVLTPAQHNFRVAFEEFKSARSADEMRASATRYRWMATPAFVEEVVTVLRREEPDYAIGIFDERLRWLREVPSDPLNLAFEAFNKVTSLEEMKQTVERFPFMSDPGYLEQLELALDRQVSDEDRSLFEERLRWLRAVPTDPLQQMLQAFAAANSVAEMRDTAGRFPLLLDPRAITKLEEMLEHYSDKAERAEGEQRIDWVRQVQADELGIDGLVAGGSALLDETRMELVGDALRMLTFQLTEAQSENFSLSQESVDTFRTNKSFIDYVLGEIEGAPLIHQLLLRAGLAYEIAFTLIVALRNQDPDIAREADLAAQGRFADWEENPNLVEQIILTDDPVAALSMWDALLAASKDYLRQIVAMTKFDWQRVDEEDYDADTWLERAQYWVDQGDLDKAIECATSAIQTDPQTARAHTLLGALQMELGDRQSAVESLETAINLDPDYLLAYWNLHFCQWQIGDHNGSIRTLELMAGRVPHTKNIELFAGMPLNMLYSKIGWAYEMTGRPEQAEKAYTMARRLMADY